MSTARRVVSPILREGSWTDTLLQGQVRYVVHGAWAPFAFDPGALIGYANVNYTVG